MGATKAGQPIEEHQADLYAGLDSPEPVRVLNTALAHVLPGTSRSSCNSGTSCADRRPDQVAGVVRDAVRAGKLVAPVRLVAYLNPIASHLRNSASGDGRSLASDLFELAGVTPEGWTRD
ncbi:MAG: hypothetical protein ACR2KG_06310 [Nocardioidaceae bacterium]